MSKYEIRFTDQSGTETIEMEEDVTEPIDWFETHCKTSERGETLTLLKDGVEVTTYVND